METQHCTFWVFWTDEEWPADGVIEVWADSPEAAKVAANELLREKAERGEGPRKWSWTYEPTNRKPNWLK